MTPPGNSTSDDDKATNSTDASGNSTASAADAEKAKEKWAKEMKEVAEGTLLYPALFWKAQEEADRTKESPGKYVAIYGCCLLFLFLGIAVISDYFMEGIEYICRKAHVETDENGNLLMRRAWNASVANVSLMAVGSSAPELSLALVGICTNGFVGDIGGRSGNFLEFLSMVQYVLGLVPEGQVFGEGGRPRVFGDEGTGRGEVGRSG